MKYKAEDLWDSIETACTITCSNCVKQSDIHCVDSDDAPDIFFNEGWRSTKNGNVYCPKCAKKKLKQKVDKRNS